MRSELIINDDPKSPVSEIFRTLRTNIQFMSAKGKLKTILVTSTLPSEGKSWASANLAASFAQTGKKVILVDADMRKGRQYTIFEVAPTPGLSNYLSGVGEDDETAEIEDYIQETFVENLSVISAGNVPPNPSELLGSERMSEMIEKLKELADYVIIDGTPSQLVADSLIVARMVDSTIIVTASKQTKKEDLKRIVNNIEQVGGKIAGIVVNKMNISAKAYGQTYYYGDSNQEKKHKKKKPVPVKKIKKKYKDEFEMIDEQEED